MSYTEQMRKRKQYAANRERDGARYRWLREHFRFANDSTQELWFNASLKPSVTTKPEELDAAIDAAMAATEHREQK